MTWRPEDAARQTTTRGKRPTQRGVRDVSATPPLRDVEPEAMPTVLAGMADPFDEDMSEQRMTMEQEREAIGMGFVPERHWNLVRQWMFRGIHTS